jgi:hypothetical protein
MAHTVGYTLTPLRGWGRGDWRPSVVRVRGSRMKFGEVRRPSHSRRPSVVGVARSGDRPQHGNEGPPECSGGSVI